MLNHVQQPHRLQRLTERPRGPGRHLPEVCGHLPELLRPHLIAALGRLPLAVVGQTFGVVQHAVDCHADRVQERVLIGRLGEGSLRSGVRADGGETPGEEPGVIGHDMPEDGVDAEALLAGRVALRICHVVGEAPLGVEPRLLQRHGACEKLPPPHVGGHQREFLG